MNRREFICNSVSLGVFLPTLGYASQWSGDSRHELYIYDKYLPFASISNSSLQTSIHHLQDECGAWFLHTVAPQLRKGNTQVIGVTSGADMSFLLSALTDYQMYRADVTKVTIVSGQVLISRYSSDGGAIASTADFALNNESQLANVYTKFHPRLLPIGLNAINTNTEFFLWKTL